MNISFTLPQQIIDSSPILISAPTARNGITLIQRLLNSSNKVMVFGENTAFLNLQPRICESMLMIRPDREQINARRSAFINGDKEGWYSDLGPDPEMLLAAAYEAFYKTATAYTLTAMDAGMGNWGIKNPMTDAGMIVRLRNLLKNLRVVFIYRNLYEVIRSAKARKFITDISQVATYANQWKDNLLAELDRQAPNTLFIRHDELVADAESHISQIEALTGVTGIDREVMSRKINTIRGSVRHGMSPTEYINPEDLTTEEIDTIQTIAGNVLDRFDFRPN